MDEENITQWLNAHNGANQPAFDDLYDRIYPELRKIAQAHRRRWSGNDTINTTALINEAYLKLAPMGGNYKNRTHFFATAAKVMRQVLVNYAERARAEKRTPEHTAPEDNLIVENCDTTIEELLFIDQLLKRIEDKNARYCRIVECRVFGGMGIEETAKSLQISISTVKRDWKLLSAWLHSELDLKQKRQNATTLTSA